MKVFQDDQGHEWELSINVGSIRRVKAHFPDVDLLKIDERDPAAVQPPPPDPQNPPPWEAPPLQARLTLDVVLVCECICCILKPQLDAKNVTPDQFYEQMAGAGLRNGLAAFWGDLDDFFLSLGRSDLSGLAKVQLKLLAEIVSANASAIEAWETQRTQATSQPPNALTHGNSSTVSPASSASTPTPAP